MRLSHFDIQLALVQAPLEENIYIKVPPGCGDLAGKRVGLNIGLHALKQASQEFQALLTTKIIDYGFLHFPTDTCVSPKLDPHAQAKSR